MGGLRSPRKATVVSTLLKGRMTRFAWLAALLASPLLLTLDPSPTKAADPESAHPKAQAVRLPGGEQRITLRLRQLDLGDALRLIARLNR